MRHVRVSDLWIQDLTARGEITIHKIAGEKNVADIFTNNLCARIMNELLSSIPIHYPDDRAESQLK